MVHLGPTLEWCCLCSDVICEFPLRDMMAFHKERKAEGTLLVTKVNTLPSRRRPHPDPWQKGPHWPYPLRKST